MHSTDRTRSAIESEWVIGLKIARLHPVLVIRKPGDLVGNRRCRVQLDEFHENSQVVGELVPVIEQSRQALAPVNDEVVRYRNRIWRCLQFLRDDGNSVVEQREKLMRSGIGDAGYDVTIDLRFAERTTDVERKDGLVGYPVEGHKLRRLDRDDRRFRLGIDCILRHFETANVECSASVWRYLARVRDVRGFQSRLPNEANLRSRRYEGRSVGVHIQICYELSPQFVRCDLVNQIKTPRQLRHLGSSGGGNEGCDFFRRFELGKRSCE